MKTISATESTAGDTAGIKNDLREFSTARRNAAIHAKSKAGNIRRVKDMVNASLSGFFSNLYAIILVNCGAKTIPIRVTTKRVKRRVVKTTLKSFLDSSSSFVDI